MFADALGPSAPTLKDILSGCANLCTTYVSMSTLRRWWYKYVEWGEIPHKVAAQKRRMKAWDKTTILNQLLNDGDVLILKGAVDDDTTCHSGEFTFLVGMTTGKFVHHNTIQSCLVESLDYSMKVPQTIAK